MARQMFINLPVKDLNRSVEFFTQLGYTFNLQFTDENATCMLIGENLFAMLLVEDYFRTFTDREVIDAHKGVEAIVALALDSREQVDEQVARARAAGGTIPRDAKDHGFMYQHAFQDPDGHLWEVFYMDENAVPQHAEAEAVAS
ncbi:MAG TPA: VOC family protein [Longimicrobiaceae bacterium]